MKSKFWSGALAAVLAASMVLSGKPPPLLPLTAERAIPGKPGESLM